MTNNNNDLKEIGNQFKKHGYIQTNKGFKQYRKNGKFAPVKDQEIIDIINRIYPNFERIPITTKLLNPYIPYITDKQYKKYEYCKAIKTGKKDIEAIKNRINTAIETNNKRKIEIDFMKSRQYKDGIQYLINNDIFTDGEKLFQYKNNDFKQLTFNDILKLTNGKYNAKDVQNLIRFALKQLTTIKTYDINEFNKYNNISNEYWEQYERITNLINTY